MNHFSYKNYILDFSLKMFLQFIYLAFSVLFSFENKLELIIVQIHVTSLSGVK